MAINDFLVINMALHETEPLLCSSLYLPMTSQHVNVTWLITLHITTKI